MNWFQEIISTYAVKQTPSFLNIIIQFGKGKAHLFEHTHNSLTQCTFEYLIIKGAKFQVDFS